MSDTDLTGLSEINALLGAGTEYEGKLAFQGRVRVDGRFVGEIRGSDVLILGATADVSARVEVGALIVLGGTLRGDVVARRLVELHAPGAVHGDIDTPQLFIDKGATFTGRCTMGSGESEIVALESQPQESLSPLDVPPFSSAGQAADLAAGAMPEASALAASSDAPEDDGPFVRAPAEDEGDASHRDVPET